jgi:4,5-DOPA dioxygenase extradiol
MIPESRRAFLGLLAASSALGISAACGRSPSPQKRDAAMNPTETPRNQAERKTSEVPPKRVMPTLFVGHGSPMNVIEDNAWSRGFAALSGWLPARPTAVLVVSAHWFVNGVFLTGDLRPRTIHDFSGFPRALYEIQYRAPGEPDLARRVRHLLGEQRAELSNEWGFDHGTWGVLRGMFPEADLPVVQLSLDRRLSPQQHLDLGRSLAELREEGVLVLGSGNIVHNLRDAIGRMHTGSRETPEWARRFDTAVAQALSDHRPEALIDLAASADGRMAHPSPDHLLPLLYVLGAATERDRVSFPIEGFDLGSVSMRSVLFG